MITFGLLLCLCTLIESLPIAKPSSDSILIDYTADSHSRFEKGTPGKSVQGSYSWKNEDKIYRVDYTADENGYRPRLSIKPVSEAEQTPVVQQETADAPPAIQDEVVEMIPPTIITHPWQEFTEDAVVFHIPSIVVSGDKGVVEVPPEPEVEDEEDKVVPLKEITADAIIYNIPLRDQPSPVAQDEEDKLVPLKEITADAIIYNFPLRDQPSPVVQNEEKVTPVEDEFLDEFLDAIVLDIPVLDESSPVIEYLNQVPIKPIQTIHVSPGTLITDLITHQDDLFNRLSESAPIQVDSQSEADKMQANQYADETAVKIPAASHPVVQQDNIQIAEPQKVVEQVKPASLIATQQVVEIPVQSDAVAQQGNIQDQFSSPNEPMDQGILYESELNVQDFVEPVDDEQYTDDAVIIDAADPFSSYYSQVNDGEQDSVQAEINQNEASDFLNALLQEYLYGIFNAAKKRQHVKTKQEETHLSKVDNIYESEPYYYNQEVSGNDEFSRMPKAEDSSNDNEYVSFEQLYENFLRHIQNSKEYQARSKVDDSIQEQTHEGLEAAFRLLMELAENYGQQLYFPKKENSKFESGTVSNDSDLIDETLMRELYYRQWLNSQQAHQQEAESMYYAIYPDSFYYN